MGWEVCIYRKKKKIIILKPKPKIQGKGTATVIGDSTTTSSLL